MLTEFLLLRIHESPGSARSIPNFWAARLRVQLSQTVEKLLRTQVGLALELGISQKIANLDGKIWGNHQNFDRLQGFHGIFPAKIICIGTWDDLG